MYRDYLRAMEYSVEYTQDDFKSPLTDPYDLQCKIYDAGLTTISYINSLYESESAFTVSIFFTETLSSEDRALLDDLIANYTYVYYENLIATVRDSRDAGSNGGTFTSGSWVTRALNTIEGSQNFCTLSGNQFTLRPGKYQINAVTCACGVQNHQFRVYNVTDSETVAVSQNGFTMNSNDSLSVTAVVIIAANTTYAVQHQCSKTINDYGFGRGVGFGEREIYTTVVISNLG